MRFTIQFFKDGVPGMFAADCCASEDPKLNGAVLRLIEQRLYADIRPSTEIDCKALPTKQA